MMLIKNNPGSNFISFACWKTIIGIDIKRVAASNGKLINVDFLFLNISEIIKAIIITLKNHHTLFKKKVRVGLLNIYQIHVKVCQLIIDHSSQITQELAIKCGKFIYAHKSSQPIGKGRNIEIRFIESINVITMNKNSVVSNFGLICSKIFLE